MTVSETAAPGLTVRGLVATMGDGSTVNFNAYCDDDGYAAALAFIGPAGDWIARFGGWWARLWTDPAAAIAEISTGPTLPAPVPPMP